MRDLCIGGVWFIYRSICCRAPIHFGVPSICTKCTLACNIDIRSEKDEYTDMLSLMEH